MVDAVYEDYGNGVGHHRPWGGSADGMEWRAFVRPDNETTSRSSYPSACARHHARLGLDRVLLVRINKNAVAMEQASCTHGMWDGADVRDRQRCQRERAGLESSGGFVGGALSGTKPALCGVYVRVMCRRCLC